MAALRRRARCRPQPRPGGSSVTASSIRRSCVTSSSVPGNDSSADSSCSIAGRSRWLVGSSSTSRLTPARLQQRQRGPGPLARRQRGRRAAHVRGPQPELRQQRAHVGVRHRGTAAPNASSSGSSAEEQPARLVDLADDDAGPERGRAGVKRNPPEQRAEQRRLAGAVRAGDRDPVGPVDLQVDRAERERAAADHRAAQRRHDRAGPRRGRDLHPQLPLLARLLDDLQPLDQPVGLPGLGGLLLGRLGAELAGRSCRCRAALRRAFRTPFSIQARWVRARSSRPARVSAYSSYSSRACRRATSRSSR